MKKRIRRKRQKIVLEALRAEFGVAGFPADLLARIRALTAGVPIDHDDPIGGTAITPAETGHELWVPDAGGMVDRMQSPEHLAALECAAAVEPGR